MVTKLSIPSHSIPFAISCADRLFHKPLLPKRHFLPLLCTISSSLTLALDEDLSYGPSLLKGRIPSRIEHPQEEEDISHSPVQKFEENTVDNEENIIDRDNFTRVFDIAAIRVRADDCYALENRLRGHLLNWPRVRNIARVPGDEMEDQFKKILRDKSNSDNRDEESFASVDRRLFGKADGDGESLSPVLYREKLAKSFNYRGFVKFRNLAKISRPKKRNKKKKKEDEEGFEENKRIAKNNFAVVEVIDDINEEDDFSGLLGDGYKRGRWRCSTRLLLLDERYANKSMEELPESVKGALKGDTMQGSRSPSELVRCNLTLFYNYWPMSEILEAMLPSGMIVPSAFETVGHIAHLNLRDEHLPYKKIIAQVVLDKNKPKIQTVVNKIDAIQDEYRTMQLEVLAGNHSLVTTVVESGVHFHVDLEKVYWNSRLATERQRLLSCFTGSDVVCDVFSGVGPIAISAARKVKHVYANDLNPLAVEYLERNCVLNKLERKIEIFNMDGRRFINAIFASQKAESITQVVMNLPNDAAEYLDAFRGIYRKKTKEKKLTLPMIHVYGFSRAQDPEFDFLERIRTALSDETVVVEMQRVRHVAPGKWMLCASFILPESVGFANKC